MLLTSRLTAREVEHIVDRVSRDQYKWSPLMGDPGNLTCSATDAGTSRDGRHKVRFTLGVLSSFHPGARTSATGRHMPKASWQAHRDVMAALFDQDEAATLVTALTTYKGRADFLARFEDTGETNCGSRMHPKALRDTAVL